MKIIIPMAGMGTRMRPHTLTIPKPLIKIAGKTIVEHLIERISSVCENKINEIAFIIGDFGEKVEIELKQIANSLGADAQIYYQKKALGTGHAIWCASKSLSQEVIIAFADTLFYADFKIKKTDEAIVWVQKVKNPSSFGVVTIDDNNYISGFAEKPKEFISDLAIIGIYYFNSGEKLQKELQYIIDNNITRNNEYEITEALKNLKNKGVVFKTGKVEKWLDCGNKQATLETHSYVLQKSESKNMISKNAIIENSQIINPCYIADGAKITNSVLGPNVSVGMKSVIDSSIITNSIIQDNTLISKSNIYDSMIGNFVKINNIFKSLNVGDYNEI